MNCAIRKLSNRTLSEKSLIRKHPFPFLGEEGRFATNICRVACTCVRASLAVFIDAEAHQHLV